MGQLFIWRYFDFNVIQSNFSRISSKNCLHTHTYTHTYTHICTYLPKISVAFPEASSHSHSSGQTKISVWVHPTSSREQHSRNILGMFFFNQLERKDSINNIKQARHLHLYLHFSSADTGASKSGVSWFFPVFKGSLVLSQLLWQIGIFSIRIVTEFTKAKQVREKFLLLWSVIPWPKSVWINLCYSLFSGLIAAMAATHPALQTYCKGK